MVDDRVSITIHAVVPDDPDELPDGMIARIVTDQGDFVGYLPAEVLEDDSDEEK